MNCNCQITYCFPSNQRIRWEQRLFHSLTFPQKLVHCFVPGDSMCTRIFHEWTNECVNKWCFLRTPVGLMRDLRRHRASKGLDEWMFLGLLKNDRHVSALCDRKANQTGTGPDWEEPSMLRTLNMTPWGGGPQCSIFLSAPALLTLLLLLQAHPCTVTLH